MFISENSTMFALKITQETLRIGQYHANQTESWITL